MITAKRWMKMLRWFLSIYILIGFVSSAFAQRDTTLLHHSRQFDYDQIFSTNHWNLFLRPSVIFAPAGDSYFSHGSAWFKLESSPMVTFGWLYEVNFQNFWRRGNDKLILGEMPRRQPPLNRWGIETGLSMQLYWLNFNYSVPMSYSGQSQYFGAPQKIQTESVLDIPVYGVYHLPFNDRHHSWLATFKAGVDINIQGSYYVEYDDEITTANNSLVPAFQLTQLSHPNQEYFVYPSFHASVGLNYILPNKKMLNLQLVGNYSPFYRETTYFSVMPGTPEQWTGSTSRTLSYAGVELNYIFTRVRRMKMPVEGSFLTRVERKLRTARMYPYDGDTLPLRKRHYTYDRIFSTNHTNFVLQFNCVPSGYTFDKIAGIRFKQRPSFGPELGWVYQVNFRKHWGLQTGLMAELESDVYDLFISKAYSGYSTNVKWRIGEATLTSIIIPIYACYYVPFHDKHESWLSNFKLGADLKYGFSPSSYGTTSFQYQDPATLQTFTTFSYTESPNSGNFFAALHASAGVNYILPNKKMLNLQIIGCWSPLYTNNIAYSILPGTAKEADGSFNRGYSYLGFQLNYILTNPLHMKRNVMK